MSASNPRQGVLPPEAARRLGLLLPFIPFAVVSVAMLGALLGLPALAGFGRGFVPMSPFAAGMAAALGIAILAIAARPGSVPIRRLVCVVAGAVALLNLGFVVGHVVGESMAFERWLALNKPQVQLTSILTDIALFAAALSILCRWLPAPASWAARQTAALVALLPQVLGVVVLISYVAGTPLLYGTDHIPMSVPTALCCLSLGAAMNLAAGCDTWPLAAFGTGSERTHRWSIFGFSAGAFTVFLLIGTLVLVGGSFYLRAQIQAARSRIHAELKSIGDLKAQEISAWYGERRSDAELISRSDLIQTQLGRFLSQHPGAPTEGEVLTWMEELQKGAYHRVVLFDGQGQARVAVPRGSVSEPSESVRQDIQRALQAKDVLLQDLHQDAAYGDTQLCLWVPIHARTTGAKTAGTLLLALDAGQFLFPLIQSWPTSMHSAETLLVRRDGADVLFLNRFRREASTTTNLRYGLAANPGMPAVRGSLGEEGLIEGQDYRGIRVLAVLKQIPGTEGCMVVKVDEAEVFGPLHQQVWVGGLGLMAILALVGATLGLMLRRHDADMVKKQLVLAQRFEWLMREANDIIFLMDDSGQILEANHQAIESYGYSHSQLLDMNILEVRTPESRVEGQALFDQTKQQQSLRFESVHRRQDGSTFPVEVSSRALFLDGEPRVIAFIRDITERRAQEAELQRMTQLYSALSQVNQAIVWSTSQGELFENMCKTMVQLGRFDMAWIGLDDPQTQRVTVAAKHGDTQGYLDRIRVESGPTPLGQGPVGTAIREGCACVENDFQAAVASKPWHAAAAEAGFRSMAAFPIRKAGKVIGALAVYATLKDFFGVREAALLEEAALDVSFALDHLAGEEQRRETERALLESDRLLLEAQKAGGVGTYTWFIPEDRWESSPVLDQIFGIGPDYPRTLDSCIDLAAPEFRDQLRAYVAGILERHEHFDLDYPINRLSDGTTRWVHCQGDIQWDAEGQPLTMVGIIQDITERKMAERALQKISVAVEQSPLSVIITDPQGVIEYVNPTFTQVSGYTAAEAIGRNPRFLKSPKTSTVVYRTMWDTLSRGETWVGEFENVKKGGESFQERATVAPVHDEAGVLVSYIALKEDITQLKRDEVERHSLETQLHQSQKLESLGSLAGGVAHDMNNVLGAILGLASALRETTDPFSPSVKSLDTIMNACLRGRGVVKSLLYFAKKDLQEERPVDLNELVKEMTQLLSHAMLNRVILNLDLQDGMGLLRGDPGALSHALMNLCVNAMDAMPGGGTLQIATRLSEDGGLALSVRDTGEGMGPEVLAKAMEPFFTTKPQGKGTGLGLAMVYGTMKAHEGAFDLSSEPGRGTEAVLRFPASRVEAAAADVFAGPSVALEPEEGLSILLVDDDELIREAVAPLLEVLGHTVVTVPGGAEALQWLESGAKVDLVILDMNMPGMSGAEALPHILSLRPGQPIIMATGYSDQEIAPLLEGYPSASSLRKPFSLKEVRQAITDMQIRRVLPQDAEPSA